MTEPRTIAVDVNQIRQEAEQTCNYLGTMLHDERQRRERAEAGSKELQRERDESRDEASALRQALERAQERLAERQVIETRRGDWAILLLCSALSLMVTLAAMRG